MEELQQTTLNLKKTLNKETQFLHTCLYLVFLFTIESKKINGLNIFDKTFLYTAYADDTTFFLKDTKSVIELLNIFKVFWTQTK